MSPPPGVHAQWSTSGSYQLEHMLETISHLPNRCTTPFSRQSSKNFAIYRLDNYCVHLMPEVRKALLKRGYVLILIGGGITGDC